MAKPARRGWIERVPSAEDRAERDVPLGLLVEALSAVAGPACVLDDFIRERPHQCLFIWPVLYGGSPAPELVP